MSYVIPGSDLSPDNKKEYRNLTVQAGINRALTARLGNRQDDLITRDLSSEDLDLESWATPALSEGVWTEWFVDSPYNMVVCIYKCLQLSPKPKVSRLAFTLDGRQAAVFDLESCYGGLPILENLRRVLMDPEARRVLDTLSGHDKEAKPVLCTTMEAWFTEPIIVDPSCQIRVELKARRAFSDGDYLVLGGFVIEPVGQTVGRHVGRLP
jgi:hypothetical protein